MAVRPNKSKKTKTKTNTGIGHASIIETLCYVFSYMALSDYLLMDIVLTQCVIHTNSG